MPELPEVETTRRGLEPWLQRRRVHAVVVREPRLRWPVPPVLARELPGQTLHGIERRAKYLLLTADRGTVIVHLGMSGSLCVVTAETPPGKADHVDVVLDDGACLRLRDPRRFGAVLWTADPTRHALLAELGPEPLGADFDDDYLYRASRGRSRTIKDLLMDSRVVAGIGNIYANESLFRARIDPRHPAGRVSRSRYRRLAAAIRATLEDAIRAGGTTLRDFRSSEGRPGYFQQQLQIYGRTGLPCLRCGSRVRTVTLGQRSTFFCPRCQS